MPELSIAKKLDLVLSEIKKNELKITIVKRGMISIQETTGGATTTHELSKNDTLTKAGIIPTDLLKLINHLIADDYIELVDTFPQTHNYYRLTINGELFIGYEKTRALQDEDIRTAENNALQAKIYANRLLWATWCAGIAAVLVLLWQVWIWFYPVHSNYPYWIWEIDPKTKK